MKLINIALATCLAAASVGSLAAGGPLDLSSGSTGFSSTPPAGSFSDSYTFTLGSSGYVSASVTTVVSGLQNIDFSSILLTGPSGALDFTKINGDPFETWALASGLLGAGDYTLRLTGTNSAAIGSYGANLAVTSVPEPGTAALLLAGLAFAGFVVGRREH